MRGLLLPVALAAAPLPVPAGWSVADAAPGEAGCFLQTEEISLFDGYADTRLHLRVSDTAVRVRTDSNIDLGYDDVGLTVDGEDFIPADAVAEETDVVFSAGVGSLIGQFIRGRAVTVYLRFWPSYPATQRYAARFSLLGFSRAYRDYQACRGGQSA